jgi:hypothetical protein
MHFGVVMDLVLVEEVHDVSGGGDALLLLTSA